MDISRENIAAAAVIAQLLVIVIMVVGCLTLGLLHDKFVPFFRRNKHRSPFPLLLLILALFSVAVLFFSDGLSALWGPLYARPSISVLPWSTALPLVFVADIVAITILVRSTGGPLSSPFSSLFALMPVLSLFLRESVFMVIVYAALSMLGWILSVGGRTGSSIPSQSTFTIVLSGWIVCASSLGLATYIGVITRPS